MALFKRLARYLSSLKYAWQYGVTPESGLKIVELANGLPCSLVHAEDVECSYCWSGDGEYSTAPAFLWERLAIARQLIARERR